MDAWVLNLKSGSLVFKDVTSFRYDSKRGSKLMVRKVAHGCRSLVVTGAAGKKMNRDDDHSNSGHSGDKDSTNHSPLLNWRDFRAELVRDELLKLTGSPKGPDPQKRSPKWAHPLSEIEPGCILVATEKLDGVRNFERSVVLLLRPGAGDPREGPFGVIVNRPLHKEVRQIKPSNPDLAATFSGCPLLFGGPLDTSVFLFRHGPHAPPGFEEVVPGVSFGGRSGLDEAAGLVRRGALRAEDFRFFVGYAGWEMEQLRDEIADGYWVVSACSSCLIDGEEEEGAEGLWGEVLQLMGGRYSQLSRKPKRDTF